VNEVTEHALVAVAPVIEAKQAKASAEEKNIRNQEVAFARKIRTSDAGMTLLELIIAIGVLAILAGAALPLARVTVQREREAELHRDLREIRNAIDRYKDVADKGLIRTEFDTEGYPPDLETLVKGVQMGSNVPGSQATGIVRFLRRIAKDPMTGRTEWGQRAVRDAPDTSSWGGKNVFDVYSLSQGTARDGTKYSDW
jgi:general secretion pathway protein G